MNTRSRAVLHPYCNIKARTRPAGYGRLPASSRQQRGIFALQAAVAGKRGENLSEILDRALQVSGFRQSFGQIVMRVPILGIGFERKPVFLNRVVKAAEILQRRS